MKSLFPYHNAVSIFSFSALFFPLLFYQNEKHFIPLTTLLTTWMGDMIIRKRSLTYFMSIVSLVFFILLPFFFLHTSSLFFFFPFTYLLFSFPLAPSFPTTNTTQ